MLSGGKNIQENRGRRSLLLVGVGLHLVGVEAPVDDAARALLRGRRQDLHHAAFGKQLEITFKRFRSRSARILHHDIQGT